MCISRWPLRHVQMEMGYGERLSHRTTICPRRFRQSFIAEEEVKGGWTRWIPKAPKSSMILCIMSLCIMSMKQFLHSREIKFHDPGEIIPLCHSLCSGRKCIIDFWFNHRQCDLEKRALKEESGNPDSLPQTTQEGGWGGGCVTLGNSLHISGLQLPRY